MDNQLLINTREKQAYLLITAVMLFIISAPYLWLTLNPPAGYVFGGVLETVEDQNVHLSWCKQAADGKFLLHNLFNSDPSIKDNQPLFINFLWWTVGSLSNLLGTPPVVLYHAARLVFTALSLWWFYQLCSWLTPDKKIRILSLVLVACSSGLGWLDWIFPALSNHFMDQPGDAMKSEAYTFHSALLYPHHIAPMGLMALTYFNVLRAQHFKHFGYLAVASIAAFLVANTHTYVAPVMAGVLIVWTVVTVIHRRMEQSVSAETPSETDSASSLYLLKTHFAWLSPLVVCFFLTVPALYQWIVFQQPEYFSAIDTTILAPSPTSLLISYGFVGILAFGGMWIMRSQPACWLVGIWAIVTIGMMYLPISLAGRMIEGLHLPLCFLASAGIIHCTKRFKYSLWRYALVLSIVGLSSISTARFFMHVVHGASADWGSLFSKIRSPVFLTQAEVAAFHFLNQYIPAEQRSKTTIFAVPMLANYAPRASGVRVFVGHWSCTADFAGKTEFSSQAFAGKIPPAALRSFFKEQSIQYVLISRHELFWAHLHKFNMPFKEWGLEKVWQQQEVSLFRVTTF